MRRNYFQNPETLGPRQPLNDNQTILQSLGDFTCQVDVARYGVLKGFSGAVRHPWNVMYLTGQFLSGVEKNAGSLKNLDTPDADALCFEAESCYFITKNVWLHFTFPRGLEIVALHFALESPRDLDIFETRREMHVLNLPAEQHQRFFQIMETGNTETQALLFAARILDTVAPLVGDRHNARRLSVDYAAVFELLQDMQRPLGCMRVADMARSMHMTREHFSRCFSRDFDMPPKSFLNNLLVRRAASRLSNSKSSVKVIAAELGFSDEFHFSRFFKRQTGQSPTRYRMLKQF